MLHERVGPASAMMRRAPVTPPVALLVLVLVALAPVRVPSGQAAGAPDRPPFADWLADVRGEALARGLSPEVVDAALAGLAPLDVVVERDRTQAEFTLTLDAYLARRLTRTTIRTARREYERHRPLLERVGRAYGVAPAVLVAVWGLESTFGRFSGVRPTIAALATLAYEGRREAFFRAQLFDALTILDRGDIEPARLKGSWAGAMGQTQFMPSSYLAYAEDFDGDGRRDIWRSMPDVFASIANYLKQSGWTGGERWGREVKLAPGAEDRLAAEAPWRTEGCVAKRDLTVPLPLGRWREIGVALARGRPLPHGSLEASLLQAGPRAFLLYRNYEALLAYNCAHAYALSVALLSDAIATGQAGPPR